MVMLDDCEDELITSWQLFLASFLYDSITASIEIWGAEAFAFACRGCGCISRRPSW
jgi:hypothetical protein